MAAAERTPRIPDIEAGPSASGPAPVLGSWRTTGADVELSLAESGATTDSSATMPPVPSEEAAAISDSQTRVLIGIIPLPSAEAPVGESATRAKAEMPSNDVATRRNGGRSRMHGGDKMEDSSIGGGLRTGDVRRSL
jgi:hypothetical protein